VLFFILLAANAAFAGWWYWSAQRSVPAAPVTNMQMNAEKVRVIPPPPIVTAPPQPASIRKVNVCLEWGVFESEESGAALAGIERLALAERAVKREVSVSANYWVHIPPHKNRAELTKRIAELKKKGVTGYQTVMETGTWHFAVGLGAFPTEEGARKRLEAVREKGLTSAVIGNREGTVIRSAFLVRDPSEQVSARLLELRAQFPSTEIKTVECPVTEATAEHPPAVTDAPTRPAPSPPR
jgi:hypothetical protein